MDKPVTDADIVAFTQILAEAQLAAVKDECIATAEKHNQKRHYTGNSQRTKRYHAQKRQKLGETGQQFIQSFFKKKPAIRGIPSAPGVDSESEEVEVKVLEEDVNDEIAVEIVTDSRGSIFEGCFQKMKAFK